MESRVLWGALCLAAVLAGPAHAQTNAQAGSAQGEVPTVTIINKGPDTTKTPAPPELVVSPQTPDVRPAAQAEPSVPTASPPQPEAAASPVRAATKPVDGAPVSAEAGAETAKTGGDAPAGEASPQGEAAAAAPPLEPTLVIDIDLSRQTMTVTEDDEPRFTWSISSARYGYRTPTGTFQPTWMAKMWYSRQYDYAPMPHAIFFHKGVAIHATYATRALGRPASHGCVRLAPRNAATLFKLVNRHGKERTQITVQGRPDHSEDQQMASGELRGRNERRSSAERVQRGSSYRYMPPSYYRRGYAAYGPPPGYSAPRTRRYYAAPRRPPRGFYSSGYSYGYGF